MDALPPDAPATVEDVRATRRWTWVAFAWAIAASAVAVLALIQANDGSSNDDRRATQGPDVSGQLRRFEQQTNDRLDQFSRRLKDRAAQSDIEDIDKKLTGLEDDLSKVRSSSSDQADALKQLQTGVDDLEQRVDELERNQQQQSQTP
jgi:septal ring factor EnvC (AmiA/AmiB activator)